MIGHTAQITSWQWDGHPAPKVNLTLHIFIMPYTSHCPSQHTNEAVGPNYPTASLVPRPHLPKVCLAMFGRILDLR